MKLAIVAAIFLVTFVSCSEYPIHVGVGAIFKGPNSETIIRGPDGSVITAEAIGGSVATEVKPEVIAEPALVVEEAAVVIPDQIVSVDVAPASGILAGDVAWNHVVPSAAVLGESYNHAVVAEAEQEAALIAHNNALLTNAQAVNLVENPIVVETDEVIDDKIESLVEADAKISAKIEGPSGSITTHGQNSVVAGPASTTITGPEVAVAPIATEHFATPPIATEHFATSPIISAQFAAAPAALNPIVHSAQLVAAYPSIQFVNPVEVPASVSKLVTGNYGAFLGKPLPLVYGNPVYDKLTLQSYK